MYGIYGMYGMYGMYDAICFYKHSWEMSQLFPEMSQLFPEMHHTFSASLNFPRIVIGWSTTSYKKPES
jgi:hypothetical protein